MEQINRVKLASAEVKLENGILTPINKSIVYTISTKKDIQNQFKTANTVYVVKNNIDLHGISVLLPKGSTIRFEGGSLTNGTLVGQDGCIIADRKVFDEVNIEGTWRCVGDVTWFAKGCEISEYSTGVYIANREDDTINIQKALDSAFRELIFPPKLFYVSNTLYLTKEKKLTLQGSDMKLSLINCKGTIRNSCVIFTDRDIDLLVIAVKENDDQHSSVTIQGGSFDTSWCTNYTHSCIKVKTDNEEKVWGLNINTSIKGREGNPYGIGIDLSPVVDPKYLQVENGTLPYNLDSFGYVTQIRIGGVISDFGTGISAKNHMNDGMSLYYNWCTDVQLNCTIINCHEAVYSNTDIDINGMIQAGHFYQGNPNNEFALINLDSTMGSIGANIYDIGQSDTTQYAVKINNANARIAQYGMFAGFRQAGLWQNHTECATGYINCLV